MLTNTLLTLALSLPTLLLAAPTTLTARQSQALCTPTSYTISSFTLDSTPPDQHIHFVFQSHFDSISIIEDAASNGATCDAVQAADGSFPTSNACSTGRNNLLFDLAGPIEAARYQIVHTWRCNGQTWMSSTPVTIEAGSGGKTFQAQNVRQLCQTPTCP